MRAAANKSNRALRNTALPLLTNTWTTNTWLLHHGDAALFKGIQMSEYGPSQGEVYQRL